MILDWSSLDSWIVLTAALAAIGCALPGTFLLLRRQSLMGDALSHAVLPGIVLAALGMEAAEQAGWVSSATLATYRLPMMFAGAACTAMLSTALTELLSRSGRLETSAALGVVYTTMFALGLLLIRLAADQTHIDPGCVLYGNLETIVTDTVHASGLPRAVVVNGALVLLNLGLLGVCYKELQVTSFDPAHAVSLGIPSGWVQQGLMAVTGATVVAAFESVGSILVIAMLVIPPACGVLLAQRLPRVLAIAAGMAAGSAVLGHVGALVLPGILRTMLAWPELGDVGTAGMMAVAAGGLFLACWIGSPQQGLIRQYRDHKRLQRRILAEDVLGALYRLEELDPDSTARYRGRTELAAALRVSAQRLDGALGSLRRHGSIEATEPGVRLTPAGRAAGKDLVRSHRLWESYLAYHFGLTAPQLHASAEQIEHYLDPHLREKLAEELDQPGVDPHGAAIPPASGEMVEG
jgi:manganese/zinc/iron transport system permease protein